MPGSESRRRQGHPGVSLALAIAVVVGGAVGLAVTDRLLRGPTSSAYRIPVEVAEVCIVAIFAVEILLQAMSTILRRRDGEAIAQSVRMLVRSLAYLILLVAVFSMLSANPTLAVSIGSVTGVIVGFATQSIFGNAVAGVLLAVGRRFRIGDRISVSGNDGTVTKISLMLTEVESGTDTVYVPNSVLLASIVRKRALVLPEEHSPVPQPRE